MATKEPRAKQSAAPYDLSDIRGLAKIVSQYELSELEVEHEGQRVRIRRENGLAAVASSAPVVPGPIPLPAPVAPTGSAPAAAPVTATAAESADPVDDGTTTITSPFVGTFYRSPSPESPAFVEEGQTVKKGQVLCIVEAMKLMNEIEAEVDCKIVKILPKNAEPVEFDQALFKVSPLA